MMEFSKTYTKKTGKILHLNGVDNYTQKDLEDLKKRRMENPSAILSICISTTSACNLRCWYCYALANKQFNPRQLKKEEYMSLISEAADLGAKTLIICGDGEPTYDALLKPILVYGVKKGLIPVVVTNGTILGNNQLANKIHKCSAKELTEFLYYHNASLLVKLETLRENLYNQLVQVDKAWDSFSKGVENMQGIGFNRTWEMGEQAFTRLAFTGVCTQENYEEVPILRQYATNLNAQFIFKVPSPTGGALTHARKKLFPLSEINNIKKYVSQYSDKHETLTPLVVDSEGHLTCMAWHLGPVITEDGNYVECYTSSGKSFGNIRNSSLRILLFRKDKDTKFSTPCPIKERLYNNLLKMNSLEGCSPSATAIAQTASARTLSCEEFEKSLFKPSSVYESSSINRFNLLTEAEDKGASKPGFFLNANYFLAAQIATGIETTRKPLRLLDIGVGHTGLTSLLVLNELSKRGILNKVRLTVIDISPEVIQKLKTKVNNNNGEMITEIVERFKIEDLKRLGSAVSRSKKICIPAKKLPFKNEAFDLVYSGFTLHHMNFKDKVLTCTEMERVLRAGGTLGIVDEYLSYEQYSELFPSLSMNAPAAQESFLKMDVILSFFENIEVLGKQAEDKYYFFFGKKR